MQTNRSPFQLSTLQRPYKQWHRPQYTSALQALSDQTVADLISAPVPPGLNRRDSKSAFPGTVLVYQSLHHDQCRNQVQQGMGNLGIGLVVKNVHSIDYRSQFLNSVHSSVHTLVKMYPRSHFPLVRSTTALPLAYPYYRQGYKVSCAFGARE